ncbi:MAG TPA: copper resistance protein CopC [Gemmatimonadaceae bacterium]
MRILSRLAFALALVAATAARAHAHASLISSTPSNGQVVASSPELIRLVFSEPIVVELSHVMLVSADGRETRLNVTGDPHEVRALVATVSGLNSGGYRVEWHIVSADGHPVMGSIAFSVGAASQSPPPAMEMHHEATHMAMSHGGPIVGGAALLPAIFRGAALSALLGLCGMLGFAAYTDKRSRLQQRMCTWLSVASVVFLVIHLLLWLMHVSPEGRIDPGMVQAAIQREVGFDEMLRLIFAALAAWALLLARQWKLAFAFSLAAVLAGGTIGHPAAIDPVIAIPAKAVHLAGVAFWFGGILWLATTDPESPDIISSATTVSGVALVSITLVAVTGIIQAFLFLNDFSDLITSAYGLTLLAKIAGLGVLFAFGAYHRSRLLPRLATEGTAIALRRSVRAEIAVMIVVILIGGFLAYVPVPLSNP